MSLRSMYEFKYSCTTENSSCIIGKLVVCFTLFLKLCKDVLCNPIPQSYEHIFYIYIYICMYVEWSLLRNNHIAPSKVITYIYKTCKKLICNIMCNFIKTAMKYSQICEVWQASKCACWERLQEGVATQVPAKKTGALSHQAQIKIY